MLTCRDVDLMLQDHLDGTLLPSQQEVLERHLGACPAAGRRSPGSRASTRGSSASATSRRRPISPARSWTRSPRTSIAPPRCGLAARWAAVPALLAAVLVAGFLLKGQYELRSLTAERELEVSFRAPAATSVAVVGDFNKWDPQRNLMVRASREGVWGAKLRLPPGVYQYSFVVDGKVWEVDPRARSFVEDGFGGKNSVIIVDG